MIGYNNSVLWSPVGEVERAAGERGLPGAAGVHLGAAAAWPRSTALPSCESAGNVRSAGGTGSLHCEPTS